MSDFRGSKVAVDGYVWLHRGVYIAATALALGDPTSKHIDYCISKTKQLLSWGLDPIIVFDGANLPAKGKTEIARLEAREKALRRADALYVAGDKSKAHQLYSASIEVTAHMAKLFAEELRKLGVNYIVAPYEADAQIAWLCLNNKVDLVISEDSDLLCFGCPLVFYKEDGKGNGRVIRLSRLNEVDCFRQMPFEAFRLFCVLSGCDYLDSLPGVGTKKALSYMHSTLNFDIQSILRVAQMNGCSIPADYEVKVNQAILTFKHQTVFDTDKQILTHLSDHHNCLDVFGEFYDNQLAIQVANAQIDPETKKPFPDYKIIKRISQTTQVDESVIIHDSRTSNIDRPIKEFLYEKVIQKSFDDLDMFALKVGCQESQSEANESAIIDLTDNQIENRKKLKTSAEKLNDLDSLAFIV